MLTTVKFTRPPHSGKRSGVPVAGLRPLNRSKSRWGKAFAKVSLRTPCSNHYSTSGPCMVKLWGALRPLNNNDQSPTVKTQSTSLQGPGSLDGTTTPFQVEDSSAGEHSARRRETFPRLRDAPWRPPPAAHGSVCRAGDLGRPARVCSVLPSREATQRPAPRAAERPLCSFRSPSPAAPPRSRRPLRIDPRARRCR